jgi:hypothetical protein
MVLVIYVESGIDCKLYSLNIALYTYYIHCLVHQLQLALVVAAREVYDVHTFFFRI